MPAFHFFARPRVAAGLLLCGTAMLATTLVWAQPSGAGTHVVQPGDTLWGIARQNSPTPDWHALQLKNGVPVPELLQPGKVLNLPGNAEAGRGPAVPRKAGVARVPSTDLANVIELTGTAWIKQGTATQILLTVGMTVQANDTLVTDRGTFLSLGLADGSRIAMPSSSALRVLAIDGRSSRFELLSGRVESHVEKQNGRQFEIRTRTAGLGVRGTYFRARDEDGTIVAEVIEGSVQVTPSQGRQSALLLRAGQGAVLSPTAPLAPEPLLPAPQSAPSADGETLVITPVSGATGYRLQLAHDDRFFRLVQEARSDAPLFTLPLGLEPGFYYARLTAFDKHQIEGRPSERAIYLTDKGELSGPSSAHTADGRIDVLWPAPRGRRYVFELSRAADFDPVLVSHASVFNGVSVGPFSVPGTYYWRSRAVDEAGARTTDGFQGSFDIPAR